MKCPYLLKRSPRRNRSGARQTFPAAIKRWLREPLLHFLLLGSRCLLFTATCNRGRGGIESSKQIALSLDELRQMDMYFESQWHRQPTPAEFQAMVEDKVRKRSSTAKGLLWASIRTTPS